MKTHTRLILGLTALALGLFFGGMGIFELPPFGEKLSFPLAMVGVVGLAIGVFQLLTLLQNWPQTRRDLMTWSTESPLGAMVASACCIAAGLLLIAVSIWSVFASGASGRGAGRVLGMGIVLGGGLVFLGGWLLRNRLKRK